MYRSLIVKPTLVATAASRSAQWQRRVCAANVRCLSTESYTDRQAKLGRPVSPHVTIYR